MHFITVTFRGNMKKFGILKSKNKSQPARYELYATNII